MSKLLAFISFSFVDDFHKKVFRSLLADGAFSFHIYVSTSGLWSEKVSLLSKVWVKHVSAKRSRKLTVGFFTWTTHGSPSRP